MNIIERKTLKRNPPDLNGLSKRIIGVSRSDRIMDGDTMWPQHSYLCSTMAARSLTEKFITFFLPKSASYTIDTQTILISILAGPRRIHLSNILRPGVALWRQGILCVLSTLMPLRQIGNMISTVPMLTYHQ